MRRMTRLGYNEGVIEVVLVLILSGLLTFESEEGKCT
jgi:hypothetical protein